jgi:opacity protein-like surface antigen
MKKNTLAQQIFFTTCLSAVTLQANAVGNGPYLGAMMGLTRIGSGTVQAQVDNATSATNTTPVNPKSQQFNTRFYVGNQFSPYAAFEVGALLTAPVKYDSKSGVDTCDNAQVQFGAVDIDGKFILPLQDFEAYAKGGVAFVHYTTPGCFSPAYDPAHGVTCGEKEDTNKAALVLGIGASYAISQNWVADASLSRMQVGGVLKSVDIMALGVSYHFVDVYCGQFLC